MIPLHVHSYYSLLEGTPSPASLLKKAKLFNLPALALTDTNAMYGLIQFAKKAEEEKIKPLLGAFIDDPADEDINAVFLARNNEGYSDLCRIITSRKLNDDFSLVNLLSNYIPDLFIISSSIKLLKQIRNFPYVFAGLTSPSSRKRKNLNNELLVLAREREFKIAAADPVYFPDKEDYLIHKVVTAIRLNKTLDNLKDEEITDADFYFKSPQKLGELWRSLPEAMAATDFISENCSVDLQFGKYKFPVYSLPPGTTASSLLWKIVNEGMHRRYNPANDKIRRRVGYELSVISELSFEDYFLIVWDIQNEAKRRGMLTIGRGSAANSIVSYCLGITDVDPVKHNLYFERFLNKGRSSPPDIDIDFSWKERDEIIKYVFEKYGYENVAMISTHVTFKARSAFRETAKIFGFSDNEISKYSKLIPWTSAENLPNVAALYPEAKSLNFRVEPWKSIVEIASRIASFPRHLSIHPGGIIITPGPVTNFTALEYAKNKGLGLIITQPDMYSVEDLGLIKIDLLSQRSLGVLRDTMRQIEEAQEDRKVGR